MSILMQLMGRPQKQLKMLPEEECIVGREEPIPDAPAPDTLHFTMQTPLYGPFPKNCKMIMLGMGCFWCSENVFMELPGIYSTQVGYTGGVTNNPTYREVSSGRTNHNEVVRVVYDPNKISLEKILTTFWEMHNPTTPMQQGNDMGTQYRSGIYYYDEDQKGHATRSKDAYAAALAEAGITKPISTEIIPAPQFFMGEDYHQQYDAKPGANGYCGLAPLGISCPKL